LTTFDNILSVGGKDQFGYYTVDDFKTYSKIEAIEISQQKRRPPKWHFNDLIFSSYNWKIEPTETLVELYRRRAQQIRNKYDHIVLFYSGGADSGNILNTFVDNDIPFEEVATYDYWSLDSRKDNYFHAEQVNVSYPRLKILQYRGINFRHRSIDLSKISHELLIDTQWGTNRAYFANAHWGTTHLAKTYIREKNEDYQKIIESGKKLVFVWGIEKPRVIYNAKLKKYQIKFIDIVDAGPGIRTQMLNRSWEHDECFYWSPDSCDILCKQGHTIMNFFKKHQELELEEIYKDGPAPNIPDINDVFDNQKTEDGLSGRNLLNWLIYPKFDYKMFTVGKPLSLVSSLRDEYWNKDIIFQQPTNRLHEHLRTLNSFWLKDPNDTNKGLKFFSSGPYSLD
jgi:hypothetical protein